MPQNGMDTILADLESLEPSKKVESAKKAVQIAESVGLSVEVRLALLERVTGGDNDVAYDSQGRAGKRVRDIALEALLADAQRFCSKDELIKTIGGITGKPSHAVLKEWGVADADFIGYDRIREHYKSIMPRLDRIYGERYPDALLDGMVGLLKDREPGIKRQAAEYFCRLAGSRKLGHSLDALAPYLIAEKSQFHDREFESTLVMAFLCASQIENLPENAVSGLMEYVKGYGSHRVNTVEDAEKAVINAAKRGKVPQEVSDYYAQMLQSDKENVRKRGAEMLRAFSPRQTYNDETLTALAFALNDGANEIRDDAANALYIQGKRRPAEVTKALEDVIEMWGDSHKASGYARQIRDKIRNNPQTLQTLPPASIEGHDTQRLPPDGMRHKT